MKTETQGLPCGSHKPEDLKVITAISRPSTGTNRSYSVAMICGKCGFIFTGSVEEHAPQYPASNPNTG